MPGLQWAGEEVDQFVAFLNHTLELKARSFSPRVQWDLGTRIDPTAAGSYLRGLGDYFGGFWVEDGEILPLHI